MKLLPRVHTWPWYEDNVQNVNFLNVYILRAEDEPWNGDEKGKNRNLQTAFFLSWPLEEIPWECLKPVILQTC